MASRAGVKIKADWAKLTSKFHPKETTKINRLKSVIDNTAIKASSLPDSLPKIDWALYKEQASDPKLVEELEKKYCSFKIERPKAPASRLNDLKIARQQDDDRYVKFVQIAESYIEAIKGARVKYEKMIPVDQMTNEDWSLTFPDWSSSVENPALDYYGRTPGLTREEAAEFEKPDPLPYATKTAWKEWEVRKKKFYS